MSSATALVGDLPSASLVKATAVASTSTKNESSSSSSSPSSSPYNSLVTILGKRTGMTSIQAERAVGFSAITGTSLVVMKVALYAYRSLLGEDSSDDDTGECSSLVSKGIAPKQTRTASYSILGIFRRTLRRILLDESEYIARAPSANGNADDTGDANDGSDGPLVTHQGSCHCESIQFTVLAPRVLHAQDGPGKIQFRHVQVKASNFRVYAGFENLKSYYIVHSGSGNKGAHAFCERCGVHVLYAPSKSTPYVSINVRCLRDDESRKVKLTSKKDGISDGIPVAGQFDNSNSDQLSTISEVTQPFHFQMNYANQYQNSANLEYLNRTQLPARPAHLARNKSDISSMASSVMSGEGGIEVPIKQFYTTTTNTPQIQKNRRSTFSTATASLTEADSSGSTYRSQMPDLLPPMSPVSPPRTGGATFGGIDDFIFTGDSVSLMDDHMSISSGAHTQSGTISLRGKRRSLQIDTGNENDMVAGNPPRHTTVSSPETRNKMKYFMSKYKKNVS